MSWLMIATMAVGIALEFGDGNSLQDPTRELVSQRLDSFDRLR